MEYPGSPKVGVPEVQARPYQFSPKTQYHPMDQSRVS